jgi:HEAT repeat protein
MTRHPVLLITLGVALAVLPSPVSAAEPAARGKPLSTWIAALQGTDARAREEALLALAELGPAAKGAAPDIAPLLKDDRPLIRVRAALALWIIAADKEVVPVLTAALSGKDRAARVEAAQALGDVGSAAAEAVPALLGALTGDDRKLDAAVEAALQSIGNAGTAPLIQALRHKDPQVRCNVCDFLGVQRHLPRELLAALRERLDDDDARTRVLAA